VRCSELAIFLIYVSVRRVGAGASAGSIVAAMVACKTEEEMGPMFDPYTYDNFDMLGTVEELTTHTSPTVARLKNIIKKGVLFDSAVLKKFLRSQVRNPAGLESRHLESRPKAAARLDLEVAAGWVSPCSRSAASTRAVGNRNIWGLE
jgi:predicted acylesterase/phospholipase RssA